MKRLFGAAALVLVSVALFAGQAVAAPAMAPEYGRSLPPVGFVKFCVSNPAECKQVSRRAKRVEVSQPVWSSLFKVNARVNADIAPVSDADLYGVPEHWTYPVSAGDCEDYLLLKKRQLEKLGFDPSSLLITVVLDEKNEGHAVLTVATSQGDYVLDNRRNDILLWSDTGYSFLKRQSQQDPRAWVALTDVNQTAPKVTSNNN